MVHRYYTCIKHEKVETRLSSQLLTLSKKSLVCLKHWNLFGDKILGQYSGTLNTCVIIGKIKSPSSGWSIQLRELLLLDFRTSVVGGLFHTREYDFLDASVWFEENILWPRWHIENTPFVLWQQNAGIWRAFDNWCYMQKALQIEILSLFTLMFLT